MPSLSPLAKLVGKPKMNRTRRGQLFGVVAHTPGSTIVQKALEASKDPFEYVRDDYVASKEGPTYLIGYSGQISQIADEARVSWHTGVTAAQRRAFQTGKWRDEVPGHKFWDSFWNPRGIQNPTDFYHLVEGATVNDAFIGVEIVPLVPTPKGVRYTLEQHDAFAALVSDIVARHAIFAEHPEQMILGHEDLNPLTRFNSGGGWDPGALRANPWFDWARVMSKLGGRRP